MKKKYRQGVVSHVGVVLSFVIFVTFIIFIYIIVRPAVATESNQNTLNNLKNKIVENSSADLISASVFVDAASPRVKLLNFLDIGDKIIVRNKNGEVLNAKISGQVLYVEKNDEKFLKIYGSENFENETGTPSGYVSSSYTLGLVKTEENIFEKPIINLIERYNGNYESLKEELGVSSGNDFKLGFTYANGTTISTQEREIIANVFIKNFPIKYVSKNAAQEAGYLSVGIW